MKALTRDGTEFPLLFRMKNLSMSALMCRHPMASGLLHILLGSLMYGTVTYGRLIFTVMMTIISLIGVNMEERELVRTGGDAYRVLCDWVPKQLIPDYRVLFYSDQQINQVRNSILAASKLQ